MVCNEDDFLDGNARECEDEVAAVLYLKFREWGIDIVVGDEIGGVLVDEDVVVYWTGQLMRGGKWISGRQMCGSSKWCIGNSTGMFFLCQLACWRHRSKSSVISGWRNSPGVC